MRLFYWLGLTPHHLVHFQCGVGAVERVPGRQPALHTAPDQVLCGTHLDDQAARLLLSLMEQISRSDEGERMAQARLEALYPADAVGERSIKEGATSEASHVERRLIASLLDSMSIAFGDDDVQHEVVERFLWKMGRGEQRRQILLAVSGTL